ncbi:MAG: thioredoxin domain-containing protein [Bacteroidetes bacterium]|nr:thioredoxin domain-containing protein [Bacteroidota bacterium]
MKENNPKYTNSLINESSPYLLQHAHNPVNWFSWNEEILEKARVENKLILISVGYSACHWCHVMEHESFEDEQVAKLMNDHFICIKVDREERPDIDQVYMMAVQLMTGQGGWPLNCFALPDGRPIYGGTYFPKQNWMNILLNLADTFKHEPEKVLDYANKLTEGVKLAELVKINSEEKELSIETLHKSVQTWQQKFDDIDGGPNRSPKFPLPNNYQFLLRYAHHTENEAVLKHIELTLKKMAYGGIYDQIGGGFSRYSVDHLWKAPHFEKMLYDNAQLVTLYSEAYQKTKEPIYKQIVYETLAFVERELTSSEGGFYAALDADSEGIEGKYYVWTKDELKNILKDKFDLFADYFNVSARGLWEHGNYILLRNDEDVVISNRNKVSTEDLKHIIEECKKTLLSIREIRIRPGLDNKIITSWNSLMLKAYIDAYNVFDDQHFLDVANKNVTFILKNCFQNDEQLSHLAARSQTFNDNSKREYHSVNGFLEDYSFTIEAFIAMYETTFEENYLHKANGLIKYVIEHFIDKNSGMFYFTSDEDKALITRKMELSDNVIPASNSSIAKSLFILGHHFENEEYISMSRRMLSNVLEEIVGYGSGYSNWAMLLLYFSQPFYELAIVGKSVDEKRKSLNKHYNPNRIFAGSTTQSLLPLLKNRYTEKETLIYVCTNKTCLQPVKEIEKALQLMNIE